MDQVDQNRSEVRSQDESPTDSTQDSIAAKGNFGTEMTSNPDNPDKAGSHQTCEVEPKSSIVTIFNTSAKSGSQEVASTRDDRKEVKERLFGPRFEQPKKTADQPSNASVQDSKGTGSKGPMEEDELKGQSTIRLES